MEYLCWANKVEQTENMLNCYEKSDMYAIGYEFSTCS